MTKSGNKLDQIVKSAEKAVQYNHDPETALMYSRRAAETICKELYEDVFQKTPGRLTFNNLIGELTQRNALPRKVMYSMRVIQNFGGINAHDAEDIEECLKPALEFFSIIVNWYFQDYKKIDVPEQIQFRPANEIIFPSEAKMVEPLPIADFEDETVVSEKPSRSSRSSIEVLDVFGYHGSVIYGLKISNGLEKPIVVGCSIKCPNGHIIDVPAKQLKDSGLVLWKIKAPNACQNNPDLIMDGWSGQIKFALWEDESFQNRLAEIDWTNWSAYWLIGSSTVGLDMQDERIEKDYGKQAEKWSFSEERGE